MACRKRIWRSAAIPAGRDPTPVPRFDWQVALVTARGCLGSAGLIRLQPQSRLPFASLPEPVRGVYHDPGSHQISAPTESSHPPSPLGIGRKAAGFRQLSEVMFRVSRSCGSQGNVGVTLRNTSEKPPLRIQLQLSATSIPMLRAVPWIIRRACSRSRAFRSSIFLLQISSI